MNLLRGSCAVVLLIAAVSGSFAQQPPRAATPTATTIDELQRRITSLEIQVEALRGKTANKYANLDCNTGKFDESQFSTTTFTFLAACTKIEPYLEGHRISISLGNPYAFDFTGVTGKLWYGRDLVDLWQRNAEVITTSTLRGGAWTVVVVTINPSKPEQLRRLAIELSFGSAGSIR